MVFLLLSILISKQLEHGCAKRKNNHGTITARISPKWNLTLWSSLISWVKCIFPSHAKRDCNLHIHFQMESRSWKTFKSGIVVSKHCILFWQVGDLSEQNGYFKMQLTQAKRDLLTKKSLHHLPFAIENTRCSRNCCTDMLGNFFARLRTNKMAVTGEQG